MSALEFWRGAVQVLIGSLVGVAIAGIIFAGAVYAGVLAPV